MAVKLLAPYNGLPTGTIMNTGDQATEAALVSRLLATFNLSGGTPYVPNAPYAETPAASTPTQTIWDKLRRGYEINRNANPHTLPVMTSPPTETLLAAIPQGFISYPVQNAAGASTGIASFTGGDPINFSGGFRVQVAAVITGGNVSTTTNGNAWRAKFIVDAAAPVFLMLNNPNVVRFLVRGTNGMQYVETTGVTPSNAGYGNFIQLTFSARATREIWVETYGSGAISAVCVLPNESVKPAETGLRMTVLGDSLAAGTLTGANINVCDGIFTVMTDALGIYDPRLSGVASTGVLQPSTNYNLIQRLTPSINPAAFTLDAPASDVFVIAMGTNDTTFSYAALVSGYAQCLQLLLVQYPTTPIIVLGCPPGKPGPTEASTTTDLAIQAACAQVNSTLVVYTPNAARTPNPPVFGAGAVTVEQSGTVTATGALSAVTTCTLTSGFVGLTGGYQITFSDGTQKSINITHGTTTLTWSGAVTATASIIYAGMTGAIAFTTALAVGATSATLTTGFSNHGLNSTAYITFSSGEVRIATLTGGSTAVSWADALLAPATTVASWHDSTTYAGPSDVYFTTTSGAHPNSGGALNFGLDYADALYGLIKGL